MRLKSLPQGLSGLITLLTRRILLPHRYFNLIFDGEFLEKVVNETNRYAYQSLAAVAAKAALAAAATAAAAGSDSDKVADRAVDNPWTDAILSEMKAYIAMNIAMGHNGHTAVDDIWNTRPLLHDSCLSQIM